MIHTVTDAPILEVGIISIIIAILGCVVLIGKGDFLIAGYNTASKKEKEKYNIRRLRWLTAVVCWIAALYSMFVLLFSANSVLVGVMTVFFVIIVLLMVILSNTWAKR